MREHDHIVEPLFGALRHPPAEGEAPREARPRRARGRVLLGIFLGLAALIGALALLS